MLKEAVMALEYDAKYQQAIDLIHERFQSTYRGENGDPLSRLPTTVGNWLLSKGVTQRMLCDSIRFEFSNLVSENGQKPEWHKMEKALGRLWRRAMT